MWVDFLSIAELYNIYKIDVYFYINSMNICKGIFILKLERYSYKNKNLLKKL